MSIERAWKCAAVASVVAGLSVLLGACGSGKSTLPDDDSGVGSDTSTGGGDSSMTGCPTGQQSCAGNCTPVALDPANCGACGKACAMGEVCSQGMCALGCGGGTTKCGMTCNDTNSDPANCGACGTKCAMGEVCTQGKCALTCPMSETKCGNSCVNTQTDRTNCGMCGTLCANGEICTAGMCVLSCQMGLTKCMVSPDGGVPDGGLGNTYCANLVSDNANCGACGKVCAQNEVCSNGNCTSTCQNGQTLCGQTCVNTQSDNLNCGGCGTVCGQGKVCASGMCTTSCGNLTQCGQSCVDVNVNPSNCGGCGTTCAGQNSTAFCSNKVCGYKCNAGFLDCNGGNDGCEANGKTDNNNCGFCSNVCTNGTTCSGGLCLPPGCAMINGTVWCKDASQGRSCNTLCTALGFGNPTITDPNWFAAQSTQPLCTQIGAAFGLSFNSLGGYAYACAEYSGAQIYCSNFNGCPTSHRTTSDAAPFGAICPCK